MKNCRKKNIIVKQSLNLIHKLVYSNKLNNKSQTKPFHLTYVIFFYQHEQQKQQ